MKVVHLPVYEDNPYQKLLMRALQAEGIEVVSGGAGGNFLRTALRRWRANALHFHWLHPYLLRPTWCGSLRRSVRFLIEIVILKMARQRVVWTVHNLQNHARHQVRLEKFFTRRFVRLADAVIVHTEHSRREAIRVFKINPSKVAVIPHGNYIGYYPNYVSQAEARKELGIEQNDFVFLFLGRIEPYKGVLELIQTFKRLSAPGTRLLIAGNSSDNSLTDAIKREASQGGSISFHPGFVPDDRIQYFINAADVVVFPYRDILNSGALILAMSYGKACIAPKLGAMPELLGGRGGFLYDAEKPEALFQALKQAWKQKTQVSIMGETNLSLASRWDWKGIAGKTIEVYRRVWRHGN